MFLYTSLHYSTSKFNKRVLFGRNNQLKDTKASPIYFPHQYFWFMPRLTVSNFLMKNSSLSFLYRSDCVLTCSITEILKFSTLCPGLLKWAPVACVVTLFTTQPLCSANRKRKFLFVSPIYLFSVQFSFVHSTIYTTLEALHVSDLFMCHSLFLLTLCFFVTFMYGQAPQKT